MEIIFLFVGIACWYYINFSRAKQDISSTTQQVKAKIVRNKIEKVTFK